MDPNTGVDELALGAFLLLAGGLYLYFREAAWRIQARHYKRWSDAFPQLFRWTSLRIWTEEPVQRWVVLLTGLVMITVGVGFIVWALIWGWP